MSGKTEFVMPSAAEQLRAEEAMLRIDWYRLQDMTEMQAEALIQLAVALVEWESDPLDRYATPFVYREYTKVARALGVL